MTPKNCAAAAAMLLAVCGSAAAEDFDLDAMCAAADKF